MTPEEKLQLEALLSTGREIPLTDREQLVLGKNPPVSKREFLQRLWLPYASYGNPSEVYIQVVRAVMRKKDFWGNPVTFDQIVNKYAEHDSIYGKQYFPRWLSRERWNDNAKPGDAKAYVTTAEQRVLELTERLKAIRDELDEILGGNLNPPTGSHAVDPVTS
ncbi:MAG: hypothetical protein KJZ58_13655 [Flavobacteriales bacterium]|nr:hypothetical protein [Flavobacteriales bacterium]